MCGQTEPDTTSLSQPALSPDTLVVLADSLPLLQDSLPPAAPNRFSGSAPINWDEIKLSPDAPEEQIDYSARDSMFFDLQNKQIHLYGEAKVDYQSMSMTANYILIDWNENTMTAEGKRSLAGTWIGKPTFVQGSQNFTASKLRYNFKTYKGIIFDAQTMQEGMNVVGTKGKFIGAGDDTTKANVIYNRDAIRRAVEPRNRGHPDANLAPVRVFPDDHGQAHRAYFSARLPILGGVGLWPRRRRMVFSDERLLGPHPHD